jgi:hypothetical protein
MDRPPRWRAPFYQNGRCQPGRLWDPPSLEQANFEATSREQTIDLDMWVMNGHRRQSRQIDTSEVMTVAIPSVVTAACGAAKLVTPWVDSVEARQMRVSLLENCVRDDAIASDAACTWRKRSGANCGAPTHTK